MKLSTLLILVIISVLCGETFAWKVFHNGRMRGGNLGKPRTDLRKRQNQSSVTEDWFTQTLDHFTPTDSRTWKQRYFTNTQFYKYGGPIFLMIGGEGEASDKWMTNGAWVEYAKQYNASLFQLEHRYYGKSRPTQDLSTKNLKYLTSQQALADLATFINGMNEKYVFPSNVKWIAFGGSYPGSLAAWLRAKYPHLIIGSVSSSGPILAKLDFKEYYNVVADSLATVSDDCVTAVKDGFQQVEILLEKEDGQKNLNKLFKLCDPIENALDNPDDISNFFENLASNFAGVVQYNRDNRIGPWSGRNITIDTICNIMTNQGIGPEVNRLAKFNELLLNTYDEKCLDYTYEKMIDSYRNISWDSEIAEGGRQWTYQTCTEFGFYQTSSYDTHVFGNRFPVEFFTQQCVDIFGKNFNKDFIESAIERTNTIYGGYELEVTDVAFIQGSIDPWHALGITKDLNVASHAYYLEGTAHCANMYPPTDDDSQALREVRTIIASLIGLWLEVYP